MFERFLRALMFRGSETKAGIPDVFGIPGFDVGGNDDCSTQCSTPNAGNGNLTPTSVCSGVVSAGSFGIGYREPEATPETVIEFMTDVEGSWEYFLRFIDKSRILSWVSADRGVWGPGTLSLVPESILVFGGDACDKGPADIRITKILVDLKRRLPDQVVLILGNRDIMKLRFSAELASRVDAEPWMPTWDPNCETFDAFVSERCLEKTRISKLKWLLHCTMGCQDTTYITRKAELELLYGKGSDEDALMSYLDSVDPASGDPWMLDYLRLGRIGAILDDTLFVHGGLTEHSVGIVPNDEKTYNCVHDWVNALNAWKDKELWDYQDAPMFYIDDDDAWRRGGSALINYGTPGAGAQTVVYNNPFVNGNPVQRVPEVQEYLRAGGIRRLVSGHQPHGQSPTVVRHSLTGLVAVTGDTSRSDNEACKLANPADNRGYAVSIISIRGPRLTIDGILTSGQVHGCTLHIDPNEDDVADSFVGRQLDNGSWVKTVLRERTHRRQRVVAALGKGFEIFTEELNLREVKRGNCTNRKVL